jgi:hypothetical protein
MASEHLRVVFLFARYAWRLARNHFRPLVIEIRNYSATILKTAGASSNEGHPAPCS